MSLMQLLLSSVQSGYNLLRSLRFRASASAYLNRTVGTPTNNKILTVSFWVKRGALTATRQGLIGAINAGASSYWMVEFDAGNALTVFDINAPSTTALTTTQVFRDPSAWYHIVVAVDTTQATASNRTKVYVNGSQVTAFSVSNYPSQNSNIYFNTSGVVASVGSYNPFSLPYYFDGYLAEVNFIDGQALTPASFGSTNALTGVWQPAPYTGTYGTNGFYLKFTDNSTAAALGTDFSGNSNTWTVNNISVTAGTTYDSMTDVPTLTNATTANCCVMNPLNALAPATLTEGNLTLSSSSAAWRTALSTIQLPLTGKWYFECTIGSGGVGNGVEIGLVSYDQTVYRTYKSTGTKNSNTGGVVAYGTSYGASAVIGVAIDSDAGTIAFYNNNTAQGTAFTDVTSAVPASGWYLAVQANNSSNHAANFGQRPFSYTPPTGFAALNTFNLPTSTIVKGNTVMDATLYTGNGSTQTITNAAGFRPDFVWLKSRSIVNSHALYDSVRGIYNSLFSNATSAEVNEVNTLTAFNSNGFSIGSEARTNTNAATYVAWQWQAGQGSSSSNTNGSITSTVSVNATAGFSVVTYTGTGSAATVGHGLGVAPKMIIAKSRSNAGGDSGIWVVYHASLISPSYFLYLNQTDAQTLATTVWNATAPTSTVFSIGTASGSGTASTHVAYCFAEIDGFSKFGSYVGNGSADGPFIYTGFKPAFVLRKGISIAGIPWSIVDDARNPYNLVNANLFPNTNGAESVPSGEVDFLSNGFKFRSSSFSISGETYIYAAFAENPYKNS